MITLLTAVASFLGFIVAYHTYGKWLANKVFRLSPDATVPSVQLRDDIDYIPTKKEIIFGHHFTSIAGTGPIVGPALAVIWGERSAAIEQEACEILGVRTLRDYFAEKKSGGKFFKDHLKRYSKSRRKAPIYWPLSTYSGNSFR